MLKQLVFGSAVVACLCVSTGHAQLITLFDEDFEDPSGINTTNPGGPNYFRGRYVASDAVPGLSTAQSVSPTTSMLMDPNTFFGGSTNNQWFAVVTPQVYVPTHYEAWIRVDNADPDSEEIGVWGNSNLGLYANAVRLRRLITGTVGYNIGETGTVATNIPFVTDTWYHVGFDLDPSDGSVDVFFSTTASLGAPIASGFSTSGNGNIIANGVGAMSFYSDSTNPEFYIDDIFIQGDFPVATSYTWTASNLGSWVSSTNWTPIGGPPAADKTAHFGNTIAVPTHVIVNNAVSINRIEFDNAAASYAIGGLSTVTLATDASSPDPSIEVFSGSHQFQVQVNLGGNTTVTSGDATQLDFNNLIDLGANDLTIIRDPGGVTNDGVVNINNVVLGTGTLTNNATLAAASSTLIGNDLISTGILDFDITPDSAGQFNVGGTASLDGSINVDFLDGETPSGDITLLTSGSPIVLPGGGVGSLGLNVTGASGLSLALGGGGTSLLLTSSAVPEPTTVTLLLLGAMVCLGRGRARKSGRVMFKQLIFGSAVVACLCVSTGHAQLTTLFDEDFEDPSGINTTNPGGPNYFRGRYVASDAVPGLSTAQSVSPTHSMLMDPNTFFNSTNNQWFAETGPQVYVPTHYELWMRVDNTDQNSEEIGIWGHSNLGLYSNAVRMARRDGPNWGYWFADGGVWTDSGIPFDPNTWYHVGFDLDPSDGSIDVFLSTTASLGSPIASGFATSGNGNLIANGAGAIAFYSDSTNPEFYIDDVLVQANFPAEATYRWTASNFGNWETPGNWTPAGGPPGADKTAVFDDTSIAVPTVASVNSPVSVNRIEFDSAVSYGIGGLSTVTLATDASSPDPSIEVFSGSHEFQTQVNLGGNTTVTSGDATQLDFNNLIDLGANDLTIIRDPGGVTNDGVVNINNVVLGTGTLTNNATLATASSTSIGGDLSSDGTLDFDITPNSAGLLSVGGTATLEGSINVDFLDGETPAGDITLLTSSSPIVLPGGGVGSLGLNVTGASGLSLALGGGGTSLLLTSGFDPADLNMDGFVDGLDLGILLGSWDTVTTPDMGELNGTPPVDGLDLGILLGAWNPPPLGAVTAVPEPASLALSGLAGLLLLAGNRNRHR